MIGWTVQTSLPSPLLSAVSHSYRRTTGQLDVVKRQKAFGVCVSNRYPLPLFSCTQIAPLLPVFSTPLRIFRSELSNAMRTGIRKTKLRTSSRRRVAYLCIHNPGGRCDSSRVAAAPAPAVVVGVANGRKSSWGRR